MKKFATFVKNCRSLRLAFASIALLVMASAASGQKATATLSLDEAFFDVLLDSVFKDFDPPEFSIAGRMFPNTFGRSVNAFAGTTAGNCTQTVKILRETSGVRTAVRFREGRIYVPLAFSGSYSPPFVGCVEFGGFAEANVELTYEAGRQRLIGRATVFNVNLNGSGGLGGPIIARMLQSSIDNKLNPIEILTLEKLSFGFPINQSGNLRMKAVAVRPVLGNGNLNLHIDYTFSKG
jgi:hypothetical protein